MVFLSTHGLSTHGIFLVILCIQEVGILRAHTHKPGFKQLQDGCFIGFIYSRFRDIEGSHIRARPILPFYCGFDRERGFRVFRLAGVSVFRAFFSMSGFWGT